MGWLPVLVMLVLALPRRSWVQAPAWWRWSVRWRSPA
jgi:hypothetical protein